MLLTVFTGGRALYVTCSLEIKVFSVKSAFGSCLLRSTLTVMDILYLNFVPLQALKVQYLVTGGGGGR